MAALPDLITVAQFAQLAEGGDHTYELHHGVVVRVTRPKLPHSRMQRHLIRILEARLQEFGEVTLEPPYRPLAEFELQVADVAVVSRHRWDEEGQGGYLRGAPELVVEVKSPSNRKGDLQELATLCLANGALEFWVVDLERKIVSVVRREGAVVVYSPGSSIPLDAPGAGELPVDEIFA